MQKRPTFVFQFSSEKDASSFREYAFSHSQTTLAQHPVRNSVPDKSRVLVRGIGSTVYDIYLEKELEAKAHSMGGVLINK